MRGLTARIMVAGSLGVILALGAPVAAFADSNTTTTTTVPSSTNPSSDWLNSENAFISHRHQVRMAYKQAVSTARLAFNAAISHAHGAQAKNAARAALLSAIANADAVQTSALAALGAGPLASGSLDTSEYLLERQAINQDYADAVDAQRITFQAVMAAASNSAQMVTARADLKLGIAEATMQRSSELIALGSRPSKHKSPNSPVTTSTVHREN